MTVLSHLTNVSVNAVLNGTEKEQINRSVSTLETRLNSCFGHQLTSKFRFGSSTRGTILPRKMDSKSDIDYMVVFSDSSYKPGTYLDRLRRFVEHYYARSEIHQSSPTIVLELNHIKFELVPAIYSKFSGYQIPAPASNFSEWISTDPNDFNETLTDKNKNNKNLIKPLVRLVKYWNAENGYPFESYLLEKKVVDQYYSLCSDLKDYFYHFMDSLDFGYFDPQWKKDKLSRAKTIINATKQYERDNMPYSAESEIKKLIPSV